MKTIDYTRKINKSFNSNNSFYIDDDILLNNFGGNNIDSPNSLLSFKKQSTNNIYKFKQ